MVNTKLMNIYWRTQSQIVITETLTVGIRSLSKQHITDWFLSELIVVCWHDWPFNVYGLIALIQHNNTNFSLYSFAKPILSLHQPLTYFFVGIVRGGESHTESRDWRNPGHEIKEWEFLERHRYLTNDRDQGLLSWPVAWIGGPGQDQRPLLVAGNGLLVGANSWD